MAHLPDDLMMLMITPAYRLLIDQFCALTLIPNAQSLYEHMAIEFNGIDFTLEYKDNMGEGRNLSLHMGSLPARESAAAALRLLEMNFYLFANQSNCVFTLNPESRRINLGMDLLLDQLSAERLLELLGELADMVKAWRNDFFLDVDELKGQLLPKDMTRTPLR
jgi:hypothetical protein